MSETNTPDAQEVYETVLDYDQAPSAAAYHVLVSLAVEAGLIDRKEILLDTKRETVERVRRRAQNAGAVPPEPAGPPTFEELLRVRYDEVYDAARRHRRIYTLPDTTLAKVREWAEDAAATAFEQRGVRWSGSGSVDARLFYEGFERRCKGMGLNHFDLCRLFYTCYGAYVELLTMRQAAARGPLTGGTGLRSGHAWHGEAWE